MKKLLSQSIIAAAFIFGSFTGFAQDANSMEQIYQESKVKAHEIASEIDLNEDERLLLVRQITSREQTLAKVDANRENPNSTQDFDKYVTMANEQFKKNINDLFGKDRAKKILTLYVIED